MFRYVIHGAGAVGSALGGAMARAGLCVTLVGRRPHVEAIHRQNGVILKTLAGERLQPLEAVERISEIGDHPGDMVVFQTMKANDTAVAVEELQLVSRSTPVVCWQNGIGSESVTRHYFKNVYGGVVRFTATSFAPGETSFAGSGKLILGKYPDGEDECARAIAADLKKTCFAALLSNNIMQDKWLKLLVNLISCVRPLTVKNENEPELRKKLCRVLLLEGMAVLRKAGIRAASSNGTEESPEDMLNNFGAALSFAEGEGQGMKLKNSTWQSLAKKRAALEADYYAGAIVRLGDGYGVPVPYNRAVLKYLHYAAQRALGPESVPAEDIIAVAEAN